MTQFSFTDREIRKAAAQVRESMLSALPELSNEEAPFSPELREKLCRLNAVTVRRVRIRHILQNAAAAAAVLVFLFSVAMIHPDVRASVKPFYIEQFSDHFSFEYGENQIEPANPANTVRWRPTAILEGYAAEEVWRDLYWERVNYTHPTLPDIRFSSRLLEGGGTGSLNLDNEHSTQSVITINGHDAYRFDRTSPDHPNYLVWFDPAGEYVFAIHGKVSMDTLLEMAYSMEDYNKTGGIWSKILKYYTNLGVQADDIVMDLDVRARRSYKRISASITLSRATEDGTWETVDTWELQEKGFLTFSTRLEKPEPGTYRMETEVRLGRSKEVIRSVYERYYEPTIPAYNPATDPNLNPVFSEEYGYYIP